MLRTHEINRLAGRKILVTGHTGFMGSWLTKWLTMLGSDVCGYALDPPTQPNLYDALNLTMEISSDIRSDINDTESLKKTITFPALTDDIPTPESAK